MKSSAQRQAEPLPKTVNPNQNANQESSFNDNPTRPQLRLVKNPTNEADAIAQQAQAPSTTVVKGPRQGVRYVLTALGAGLLFAAAYYGTISSLQKPVSPGATAMVGALGDLIGAARNNPHPSGNNDLLSAVRNQRR